MRHRAAATIAVGIVALVTGGACAEPNQAQTAPIAEQTPESVLIGPASDHVYISGGLLGRFDTHASAEENLRTLVARLGPLSNAWRHGEFLVAEQTPTFMRFTQIIGGIPVSGRNEVDLGPDGQILGARLWVIDPERAPKGQPIALQRALQIASLAVAAKAGVADGEVELNDDPGLHYKPTALRQPLKLQYRFSARTAGRGSDIVIVDAFSGAVQITPAALP